MTEIIFCGKKYTRSGNAWVREDGVFLGQAYCSTPALAPAVGRYAVELARAGNDKVRVSQTLQQVSRSLGNGIMYVVQTLAKDLRSSGAVPAGAA
ncbi:MAG: hypothetical protein IKZ87_04630 [Actinomycetaceae bacterium]|nr:hypothetical protein [Actinomycetaceae bacterium]